MESRNPKPLSHSDYWRLQAQEARLAAQRLEDPEARADLLAKADEYDRFADCNREWETQLCKNNSVSSPGGPGAQNSPLVKRVTPPNGLNSP